MKLGMEPRKSSRVCILTAALVVRKVAQGNIDRHKSIVVESSAYAVSCNSVANSSSAYRARVQDVGVGARKDRVEFKSPPPKYACMLFMHKHLQSQTGR